MRSRIRSRLALAGTALATLAIVAAGCGGGDDNSTSAGGGGAYGGGGTSAPASSGGGTGVVSVADNPKLGSILVDSKGNTLYYFLKDKNGKSSCYGACAGVWPPYTTSGSPKGEKGAQASKLGTTKRTDGSTEVTYNGFPLYTYTGDSKPGDTNGNDFEQFGAEWYALTPAGEKPKD
jgi:predicted lipoprotein with Yx(FWY)xxD motif